MVHEHLELVSVYWGSISPLSRNKSISYLHKPDPPIVGMVVCSSGDCQAVVNVYDYHIAARVNGGGDVMNFRWETKISYGGCGETFDNLRCCACYRKVGGSAGLIHSYLCRKIVDCGQACQRRNWMRHKVGGTGV